MSQEEELVAEVREELAALMAELRAVGVDPVPILAAELEALGYRVVPPEPARDRPPALELCTDPDCSQAWAYRQPPRPHYHPRPHGPSYWQASQGRDTDRPRPDWERFGLVDADA